MRSSRAAGVPRVLGLRVLHAAIVCTIGGCSLFAKGPETPSYRAPVALDPDSPVEVRETRDRPRLSLVRREGDPEAGVALAIAHDLGSAASVALAELVALRVRSMVRDADAVAFGTGFAVRALVKDSKSAARFVKLSHEALMLPPTRAELDWVQERVRSVGMERWTEGAAEAVGRCSGELGYVGAPETKLDANEVISWLGRVRSVQMVAYAATGPRDILEAAADALDDTDVWPKDPVADDPWPEADAFTVSSGAVAGGALSVAVRVPDGARALAAARELSSAGSTLMERVRHVAPSWSVDAVVASTRLRGACVRVDLRAAQASEPPSAGAAAGVAWLVLDELSRTAVHGSATPWDLDEGVLRATDPRDAAGIAAWRALSSQLRGGPVRRFVSYRLPISRERPELRAEFERGMRHALDRWKGPTFDLASRTEEGQGEIWLLLANPCGTADETRDDGGLRALAVRALAEAFAPMSQVTLEPWITPDGIGLLAHGPKATGDEAPVAHAERIAAGLARAIVAPRVSEDAIATARAHLLAELDPERDALISAAFDALVPARPSWLDPRGGWQQLVSLTSGSVRTELRRFSAEPLRLAVLANQDEAQARAAASELARWLRPGRQKNEGCAPPQAPVARPGIYAVETRRASGTATRALVAARLGSEAARRSTEAEWTVYLLNRPGGWLDRALKLPGIATEARASLLGGSTAGAVVIEIAALERNADEAVSQVRALLGRLAAGAVTAPDLEKAADVFRAAERRAALDPRQRIVDLWREIPKAPAPTLDSVKRFHAATFVDERHVVVVERPKP